MLNKKTQKALQKQIEKKIQTNLMYEFFLELWKKRKHVCFICNTKLYGEPKSYYFDHLLEKSKYPELKLEEKNIALVCLNCHSTKSTGKIVEKYQEFINEAKLYFNK